jgi:hypothetical protein
LSWTYIFPIVVFSVILSQLLLTLPRLSRFVKGMLPQLSRLEGSKLVTYLNGLWIVAISILYLFALYSYLANLYYLNKFRAIDTSNWTLGQIVAVTIWAPVILKYIYSACCKFMPAAIFHIPLLYPTESLVCICISYSNHGKSLIWLLTTLLYSRDRGTFKSSFRGAIRDHQIEPFQSSDWHWERSPSREGNRKQWQ